MAKFIVLRLLPVEPISGDESKNAGDKFTDYLKDLTITAYDLSFEKPREGRLIGEAKYSQNYVDNNRIVQHIHFETLNIFGGTQFYPTGEGVVATALIEVPPGYPEYGTSDIHLDIKRGDTVIDYRQINYNINEVEVIGGLPPHVPVPIAPGPAVNDYLNYVGFISSLDASVYIALPAPPIDQTQLAYVQLPSDGSPPNFTELRKAVELVLKQDPTVTDDNDLKLKLSQLTAVQSRHIAYEIIYNRKVDPLPARPSFELDKMYLGPHKDDDTDEKERKKFEAALLRYYSKHNADAERLSRFVSSLSAAVYCNMRSRTANNVGIEFPISSTAGGSTSRIKKSRINLSAEQGSIIEDLQLSFEVPADYFYALAATMPPHVSSERIYQMACIEEEQRILSAFDEAIDSNTITVKALVTGHKYIDGEFSVGGAPEQVFLEQAARRLNALGLIGDNVPKYKIEGSIKELLRAWLNFPDWSKYPDGDISHFWENEEGTERYLDLVLHALINNHDLNNTDHEVLIAAIKSDLKTNSGNNIQTVEDLKNVGAGAWRNLFLPPNVALLPPFTLPGTPEERTAAFIRHVQKFFDVSSGQNSPDNQTGEEIPTFDPPALDLFNAFVTTYNVQFGTDWGDLSTIRQQIKDFFNLQPDQDAQTWLEEALFSFNELCILTNIDLSSITPADYQPTYRFSIIEALYARGFTSRQSVNILPFQNFQKALTGTVAYNFAEAIYEKSGEKHIGDIVAKAFSPINPNGSLANCIPPSHLSPLGPAAYLKEMLNLHEKSTCEDLALEEYDTTLNDFIKSNRRPLGDLHVTQSNLETPLPLIDLVNENLEALAANAYNGGVIYNTNDEILGGHKLKETGSNSDPDHKHYPFYHDPETLFSALPEHSSPSTPVKSPQAYDNLKKDFSSPLLPYSQPLDISRSYLRWLGTSRYALMRRFRKDIAEFVLDPVNEPNGFQHHLWRYPVKIDVAREYLGITPEEYDQLFTHNIVTSEIEGEIFLKQLYGFKPNDDSWIGTVTKLSEFLKRTGLDYCVFLELQRSEFVIFEFAASRAEYNDEKTSISECEPCCLENYTISFLTPNDAKEALKKLAVFIRLWRKLQKVEGAKYPFSQLRGICDVLHLFRDDGTINPDFIRQLAAFQMLRDHFRLPLFDKRDPNSSDATGADRPHLLSLWAREAGKPTPEKWQWAVGELLEQIQHYSKERHYARAKHKFHTRPPEFIKLVEEYLDPLSGLMGFDSNNKNETWHAYPTHTLRFAELLSKIYASHFEVEEIFFLFTADDNLIGIDPFALQTDDEALDLPLDLPDDERDFSLWDLRRKLLEANVAEEEASSWTWPKIEASLRDDFGLQGSGLDQLQALGEHFFPGILENNGYKVESAKRQYRVNLDSAKTSPAMWNTPVDGPFHYDQSGKQLWFQLPLINKSVITKLSRIRQLNSDEQRAVQDLYFLPRADLALFAFIFANFTEAEERLIQETDESKRWDYFRSAFACCRKRCRIIAEHLSGHVSKITKAKSDEGTDLAWLLLKNLYADENNIAKGSWESDDGKVPPVTWNPPPNGSAFSALLGLTGTGLLGEFISEGTKFTWEGDKLKWDDAENIWREDCCPMEVFAPAENQWNSALPTVLPSMNLTLSHNEELFVGLRNGFALMNHNGKPLGGAQGFAVRWSGSMLIEKDGTYKFWAGTSNLHDEKPDFKPTEHHRWHVVLGRGQEKWILLSHNWPDEHIRGQCSEPMNLDRGAYQICVEFVQLKPKFLKPEEIYPQYTGFHLKYSGPDSSEQLVTIPFEKLFCDLKSKTLSANLTSVDGQAKRFLDLKFTSTLRDIRRTYERAFKALLFAQRFELSSKPESDDGQSEIGYMLSHPDNFAGYSYYWDNQTNCFSIHKAWFDFNLLPVLDNYYPPKPDQDQRAWPTSKRQQALFDWWERIFDYSIVRMETKKATEHPVWLLFHEAAEDHPDDPAHLLRYMGVDLSHATHRGPDIKTPPAGLILQYFPGYMVSSEDLEDERWSIRAWQSEKWIQDLLAHSTPRDIREARFDLWASEDPSSGAAGKQTGNENLTLFFRDGCIEHGEPRRYEDIKNLNDGLRKRAHQALLAYLCGMEHVPLCWLGKDSEGNWKQFAENPKHLSELLLLDAEAGFCEKASRIDEAISAVQIYIQRCRLGLEPTEPVASSFKISEKFAILWDKRFATFHIWEACKRREIYRENWIEWDELQEARRSEAFRFLESELHRATLTTPIPGGLEYWPDQRPPIHPGLWLLQQREPASMVRLPISSEGFDTLATPERHAHPSWLGALQIDMSNVAEVATSSSSPIGAMTYRNTRTRRDSAVIDDQKRISSFAHKLPFWIQAAIRLGANFIRVAAAGIPPASSGFESKHQEPDGGCCTECGKNHPDILDEYYFWLIDSRYFPAPKQDADWRKSDDDTHTDWHNPNELPRLLQWSSKPMMHLVWCQIHNGELQQPRWSSEGVYINQESKGSLKFFGREYDSLYFEVEGAELPSGIQTNPDPTNNYPGFRYDLPTDDAVVLPLIVATSTETPYSVGRSGVSKGTTVLSIPDVPSVKVYTNPGGLSAYPYFVYFAPGASLMPRSIYSTALSVANWLRAHCRYEAALKWFELSFNPLNEDCRKWILCPYFQANILESENVTSVQGVSIEDLIYRNRSIILHYLETLLQWGDAVMRRNSPEAFQQARLIFDTAEKIMGLRPHSVKEVISHSDAGVVLNFNTLSPALNPRLMMLYDQVADRLALIHACLNIRRIHIGRPNKDMPYWGRSLVPKGKQTSSQVCHSWQAMERICPDEDWCCIHSPYRFSFLIQKAQEIANEVRGLGAALLAAYEKGDAEYLSSLRAGHELQLLDLALVIRQHQWRDADWQVQALQETKEGAQTRRRYYYRLIENGLNNGESQYQDLIGVSLGLHEAGRGFETTGQAMGIIPDSFFGFPCSFEQIPIGSKLAGIFSTLSRIMNSQAESSSTTSSLRLTQAGWTRREEEWSHQVEVLDIEIEQIERQILGAERRRDIALRELDNHQQQMEHATEVLNFLRDKFTDQELYIWLQKETAALYYKMYELALRAARQAQAAFNYERGYTARIFVPSEPWDNLHEGLQAGERLQLSLRQMEKAYLDENVREYELTKHISLRLHYPLEFLSLQATGHCEIEIPEWMFDLDYPGHFMRRIKNVTLTIPCVVGPYTGVHCRLTLLSSSTRVDPCLIDPLGSCCNKKLKNGYSPISDDPRIVKQYAANEAVATSSGQNDSGMFELNFRDERYLPFEFAGAISRWRIELPRENNNFSFDTLSDVVLHLNYTAREGGDLLRNAANGIAQSHLSGDGLQYFNVRHDFPDAWQFFQGSHDDKNGRRNLNLRLNRSMFPYHSGHKTLKIEHLEVFFETRKVEPGSHHTVEFIRNDNDSGDERSDEPKHNIDCVGSIEWPDLYHGVLDSNLGSLTENECHDLGTFIFPSGIKEIFDVFLFCKYSFGDSVINGHH